MAELGHLMAEFRHGYGVRNRDQFELGESMNGRRCLMS